MALTALGIDPTADSRFVKSGVSVVDALCGFYVTGGGFRHLMADKTVDGMATEQGYYALAAYYRLLAQKYQPVRHERCHRHRDPRPARDARQARKARYPLHRRREPAGAVDGVRPPCPAPLCC